MSLARYLSKLGAFISSAGQVVTAGIQDGAITAVKIAAGVITGDKMAALVSSGYMDIGTVRIQWLSAVGPASASVTSGYFANYYVDLTMSFPAAFKSGSAIYASAHISTDYHDAFCVGPWQLTSTSVVVRSSCGRAGGVQSKTHYVIAIGEKP